MGKMRTIVSGWSDILGKVFLIKKFNSKTSTFELVSVSLKEHKHKLFSWKQIQTVNA